MHICLSRFSQYITAFLWWFHYLQKNFKHTAEALSGVFKCKKAVMYLMENLHVLGKLDSVMNDSAKVSLNRNKVMCWSVDGNMVKRCLQEPLPVFPLGAMVHY